MGTAMTPGSDGSGFERSFGYLPAVIAAAPGRVNLIGEFTDYNEGWVLPFALDRRTMAAAAPRRDRTVRVSTSMRRGDAPVAGVSVSLDDIEPGIGDGWAAYALGVVWAMRRAGLALGGVDLHLDTQVPIGAGLSSSAALECAVAVAVDALYRTHCPRADLAALARQAENDFVGVPSGIMDQMASLFAEEGNALLLDTRSGEVRQIPFDPPGSGFEVLVVDTRIRHELGSSDYGERRRTCLEAARLLGVDALRDIPLSGLDEALVRLPDHVSRRRVRHVVSENARVLRVAGRLSSGDVDGVGPVLTDAHRSLRDDFEVSCPELDLAVEAALGAGALGSRMVGGGFGGCAIALVRAAGVPAVAQAVTAAFRRAGLEAPTMFGATPSAGAARLL